VDFSCTQIRVLATEATREASNSVEFRDAITRATGWVVEMLAKEEEGRIGALGVASSCTRLDGLVMDLGGGSTQLTWVSVRDGEIKEGGGGGGRSVSLPFGAAALLRRIEEAEKVGPGELVKFKEDVREKLADAWDSLRRPGLEKETKEQPFNLFLSGGGFRGWGYLLMDTHKISPYPIPIINGFEVKADAFSDTVAVASHAANTASDSLDGVFRVSDRRASQVPAVALLVSSLIAALPRIASVRFCQGGVREGALFAGLPASIRAQAPLAVSTTPYASKDLEALLTLLKNALPAGKPLPEVLSHILPSIAHLIHHHASLPKETRAAVALRSTTAGVLAGVHGVSHMERAGLALALTERWGAEVSSTDEEFLGRLRELAGSETEWWTRYLGRVAALIGEVYPAGVVKKERLKLGAKWEGDVLVVDLAFGEGCDMDAFAKVVKWIDKVGKKKNWVGGKEGWGIKIDVRVS